VYCGQARFSRWGFAAPRPYDYPGKNLIVSRQAHLMEGEPMSDLTTSFRPSTGQENISREWPQVREELRAFSPAALAILERMVERYPELRPCVPELARAFETIARAFAAGGTFFICGNGGSQSDALHIAGELDKSFRHARPLSAEQRAAFEGLPGGAELAGHLQRGLPTIPLGSNPALTSAIANDNPLPHMIFAQELYSLARSGDVLLGISTSGGAQNVRYAASVARALGLPVISLTGPGGGELACQADIAIRAPGSNTAEIQGWHIQLYHALCEMLETHAFDER
jgi:D-sedoheptulose 7-phosphate isomerase